MKRTWKLTPAQKWRIKLRYCRGERVKIIADDYRVATRVVSVIAWQRGAERRDKIHNRSVINGS